MIEIDTQKDARNYKYRQSSYMIIDSSFHKDSHHTDSARKAHLTSQPKPHQSLRKLRELYHKTEFQSKLHGKFRRAQQIDLGNFQLRQTDQIQEIYQQVKVQKPLRHNSKELLDALEDDKKQIEKFKKRAFKMAPIVKKDVSQILAAHQEQTKNLLKAKSVQFPQLDKSLKKPVNLFKIKAKIQEKMKREEQSKQQLRKKINQNARQTAQRLKSKSPAKKLPISPTNKRNKSRQQQEERDLDQMNQTWSDVNPKKTSKHKQLKNSATSNNFHPSNKRVAAYNKKNSLQQRFGREVSNKKMKNEGDSSVGSKYIKKAKNKKQPSQPYESQEEDQSEVDYINEKQQKKRMQNINVQKFTSRNNSKSGSFNNRSSKQNQAVSRQKRKQQKRLKKQQEIKQRQKKARQLVQLRQNEKKQRKEKEEKKLEKIKKLQQLEGKKQQLRQEKFKKIQQQKQRKRKLKEQKEKQKQKKLQQKKINDKNASVSKQGKKVPQQRKVNKFKDAQRKKQQTQEQEQDQDSQNQRQLKDQVAVQDQQLIKKESKPSLLSNKQLRQSAGQKREKTNSIKQLNEMSKRSKKDNKRPEQNNPKLARNAKSSKKKTNQKQGPLQLTVQDQDGNISIGQHLKQRSKKKDKQTKDVKDNSVNVQDGNQEEQLQKEDPALTRGKQKNDLQQKQSKSKKSLNESKNQSKANSKGKLKQKKKGGQKKSKSKSKYQQDAKEQQNENENQGLKQRKEQKSPQRQSRRQLIQSKTSFVQKGKSKKSIEEEQLKNNSRFRKNSKDQNLVPEDGQTQSNKRRAKSKIKQKDSAQQQMKQSNQIVIRQSSKDLREGQPNQKMAGSKKKTKMTDSKFKKSIILKHTLSQEEVQGVEIKSAESSKYEGQKMARQKVSGSELSGVQDDVKQSKQKQKRFGIASTKKLNSSVKIDQPKKSSKKALANQYRKSLNYIAEDQRMAFMDRADILKKVKFFDQSKIVKYPNFIAEKRTLRPGPVSSDGKLQNLAKSWTLFKNQEELNRVKIHPLLQLSKLREVLNLLTNYNPQVITRLFEKQTDLEKTMFGVWTCKKGEWNTHILQTTMAVREDGPVTAYTDFNQLWPDILLKALVQNFGDVDKLRSNSCKNYVRALTGCTIIELTLRQSRLKRLYQIIRSALKSRSFILVQKAADKQSKFQKQYYSVLQKSMKGEGAERELILTLQDESGLQTKVELIQLIQAFSKVYICSCNPNYYSVTLYGQATEEEVIHLPLMLPRHNRLHISILQLQKEYEPVNLSLYMQNQQFLQKIGQTKSRQQEEVCFVSNLKRGVYNIFFQFNQLSALNRLGEVELKQTFRGISTARPFRLIINSEETVKVGDLATFKSNGVGLSNVCNLIKLAQADSK